MYWASQRAIQQLLGQGEGLLCLACLEEGEHEDKSPLLGSRQATPSSYSMGPTAAARRWLSSPERYDEDDKEATVLIKEGDEEP